MFINVKTLAERYNIHRATVWRWVRIGRLPKPVRFGGNVTRWRMADIEKFEAEAEKVRGAA